MLIGNTGGSTRPGRRGRRGRGENAAHKYDEAASETNPFIDAMRHSALRTRLRGKPASGADEQQEELKKQVDKLKQEREKDRELFARQKSLLEEAVCMADTLRIDLPPVFSLRGQCVHRTIAHPRRSREKRPSAAISATSCGSSRTGATARRAKTV